MLEQGDGRLPRRQTLWVPRPVGEGMRRKALYRIRSVQRLLKAAGRDGQGAVERIVGVGAALEMLAAKPRWWRRSTVRQRWYITDTEVNHLAHRLARKAATHVVVPTHWRADLDGGFLATFQGQIHRLDGLHGHVHLAPQRRPSKVSSPPRILVRRLEGGGVHDDEEIVALHTSTFLGNPVGCAAALATLDVLRSRGLVQRSATLGAWLHGLAHSSETSPAAGVDQKQPPPGAERPGVVLNNYF